MEKSREFYVTYTRSVYGTVIIMARDMKEAQEKFDNADYNMEKDYEDYEDIDFGEIEDSEE
jgi:hypothetical protein